MRIFFSLLLHRHTTVNLVRELGSMMNVPCVSTSSRGKERAHYRESLFSRHAPRDRRFDLKIFSPTAEAAFEARYGREKTQSAVKQPKVGHFQRTFFTHNLKNVLLISLERLAKKISASRLLVEQYKSQLQSATTNYWVRETFIYYFWRRFVILPLSVQLKIAARVSNQEPRCQVSSQVVIKVKLTAIKLLSSIEFAMTDHLKSN